MRVVMVAAALLIGCASPAHITRGANEHLAKAQMLEQEGDYYGAAREREAANRQFAKAQNRAYYYGY